MEEGYGDREGIPQLILAGASVDDVYVIVLFSTFLGMIQGESASIIHFINIPISIFLGVGIGFLIGVILAYYFKKVHIRDTSKVLIILSISLLLVVLEDHLTIPITFSALIAIMFIGIGLQKKREVVARRLSVKYGKLWVAAEVFLFVLVGATVNIGYLNKVGVNALVVIAVALIFRMFGVFLCLLGTSLDKKERLFAMMAYTPKATGHIKSTHYIKYFPFACSSGRSSYHTDYLFRINCNHVYRDRIAEETGSRCKTFVCKIWEIVGGSRSVFICAGRSYRKHRIS